MNKEEITFLYGKACDIWKSFSEYHNVLYQLACEEYVHLIESDLDKLEECINEKEETILKIEILEKQRANFIQKLNNMQNKINIVKARDLMNFFGHFIDDNLLERYNLLLIDIIERIQEQNKRNKIFLNKAMYSIDQIKRDFSGQKYVETYNQRGQKQMNMK